MKTKNSDVQPTGRTVRSALPWIAALLWALPLSSLGGFLVEPGSAALWAQKGHDDGYGPAPGGAGADSHDHSKEHMKGQPSTIAPATVPPGMTGPKLVIDEATYDWGTIIQGTPVEHVFRVTNPGDMDLVLDVKPG